MLKVLWHRDPVSAQGQAWAAGFCFQRLMKKARPVEVMKVFLKLANSSVKSQKTKISVIVSIKFENLFKWKPRNSINKQKKGIKGKKAGFDQSRLADECSQLKVANGKAWEINETEFSQLEKGKMRFMMWRHRAESSSITRFTINLNKEETAPPVAATLYWYTYFSLEPSTF